MTDNGKLLTALLVGAAAGSVLGILFAPDKGSETRKKISTKTSDLLDVFSKKVEEGKETLSDLKKKSSETVSDFKSKMANAAEAVDATKERAKSAVHHN